MSGQFSANASALGYFYQARYALLLLLGADVDAEMSLERYDDIAFEQEGTPKELLQTKHQINYTGSLSDASTDLWKLCGSGVRRSRMAESSRAKPFYLLSPLGGRVTAPRRVN